MTDVIPTVLARTKLRKQYGCSLLFPVYKMLSKERGKQPSQTKYVTFIPNKSGVVMYLCIYLFWSVSDYYYCYCCCCYCNHPDQIRYCNLSNLGIYLFWYVVVVVVVVVVVIVILLLLFVLNTGTDLQRKIWLRLGFMPPELKRLIQTSTKHAVPVVHEAMMNKLQEQQRLLWSSHMKEKNLKKNKDLVSQLKKLRSTLIQKNVELDRLNTKCVNTHLSIHTDVYSLIQTSIHYLFIHSNSYINYVLIYISDVQR